MRRLPFILISIFYAHIVFAQGSITATVKLPSGNSTTSVDGAHGNTADNDGRNSNANDEHAKKVATATKEFLEAPLTGYTKAALTKNLDLTIELMKLSSPPSLIQNAYPYMRGASRFFKAYDAYEAYTEYQKGNYGNFVCLALNFVHPIYGTLLGAGCNVILITIRENKKRKEKK